MHLVYRAREGDQTPMVLPPSLIPPSKRKTASQLPGAIPVLPSIPPTSVAVMGTGGRSTPPVNIGNSTLVHQLARTVREAQFSGLFGEVHVLTVYVQG